CRATIGSRCVLGNHALSAPPRPGFKDIYAQLNTLGAPISFQTESPWGMGCLWTQSIAQGVAIGAGSIEIWPKAQIGGFNGFTVEQMTQLASEFTAPINVDPQPQPLENHCSGFR